MAFISSQRLIDLARIAAIVACVGLLYSPSVGTIGLVVTYVAFLASGQAVSRFKAVLVRPLVYWGVAFLGVVLLGMVYASVPWHDRWTDFYKWRTILWFCVALAIFDEECWKERLLVIFLIGTAVAVVGSFVSAAGWVTFRRGPHELLRNNGTQGMAFACAALVCAWVMLEKKTLGLVSWIWPVFAALYIVNVIFITDARSGYAVLGVGLFMLLCWKASWSQRVLIVVGFIVAGGLVFAVSPRMQGKVRAAVVEWTTESKLERETSFGLRRVFYTNSVEILRDHWLLGLGTGGFAQAYGDHVSKKYEASDWRAVHTTDPHNQYLAVAIQQGIGGVVVFLVWIAAVARERESRGDYHRLAVAILAGWCVTSLFSSHFRTFAEGHLLATFLGVLLAVEPRSIQAKPVAAMSKEA
ncbi:O-antigen ligase family protein [Nitrospira sp. NS4]|uniref:O-antigen ligase family protein n=1 Tax=Nitrospira sp. NS4 TaxID=3414498 RepID=UPI003C2C10B6